MFYVIVLGLHLDWNEQSLVNDITILNLLTKRENSIMSLVSCIHYPKTIAENPIK